MSTTATAVIDGAFGKLGVKDPNEALSAADAQEGLRQLNLMIDLWSIEPQSIPFVSRQVFDTVSGQGGPSNPYTIGPGGDFDTTRPASIDAAALLLTTSSPNVEVPIDVFTDAAWESNAVKDLSGTQFTGLYYQPTYSGDLGKIQLWPVPNNSTYDLVLYRGDQMAGFVDLTTAYDLPPGYAAAYEYNLAAWLAPTYAKEVPAAVAVMAGRTLAALKAQNSRLVDAPNDYVQRLLPSRPYNILADN